MPRPKRKMRIKREPYYCRARASWIIPLTKGYEALVDEDDVFALSDFNWCVMEGRGVKYAVCKPKGGMKNILMHRVISQTPNDMVTDHINGNGLDNRKQNLRVVTQRENLQNRRDHRSGKLVGSSFNIGARRWEAYIRIDGRKQFLGLYDTEMEAHEAYLEACEELRAGD